MSSRPVIDRTASDTTYRDDAYATTTTARSDVAHGDRRRFSVGAVFLGWCVAAFLTLVFLGLLAAILGGAAADTTDGGTDTDASDLVGLGIGGAFAGLIGMFLAYLVGGYTAGRLARYDGSKHGLGVPVVGILAAILLGILGAALGANYDFANPFPGVDLGSIGGGALLGAIPALLAMFLGGWLGGRIAERRGYGTAWRRDRAMTRGRPL